MSVTKVLKNENFLVVDGKCDEVFIPELFNQGQVILKDRCKKFICSEVLPRRSDIDKVDRSLMKSLVLSASRQGLTGVTVPADLNGMGETVVTQMMVAESTGDDCSFSTPLMAHSGLGILPILYYGSRQQQEKYLPRLCSGELVAAFCLTEPGAGSDAGSGKTCATLSDDGCYVINGNKTWITNAGIADVHIVLAKVESDRVATAFIVDAGSDGITVGNDMPKMGIKGSPTAAIHYKNVKVPAENILGKRGEGLRIALNVLNIGRMNLCASATGAARSVIQHTFDYALKRVQFGSPIFSLGAIKQKLASQVIETFAIESAMYRVAGEVDALIALNESQGVGRGKASANAIGLFACEAALLKIKASEVLEYVADEAVQVHGGIGYAAGTVVEKVYRDARINKIFEGTNEINRTIIADALFKALKRESRMSNMCYNAENMPVTNKTFYTVIANRISNLKDVVVRSMNAVSTNFGIKLLHNQEVLMNIADMAMETYICESLFFRVSKLEKLGKATDVTRSILDVYLYDAIFKVKKAAFDAIFSLGNESESKTVSIDIEKLTMINPVNVMGARRLIADNLSQIL